MADRPFRRGFNRQPTAGPVALVAGRRRRGLGLTARERLLGYALLLPALLTVALVVFYPVLDGIRISFLRLRLTSPGPTRFVGLDNYAALLHDETFWQALRTTAIWTASNLVAQLALGTALALLLNERLRARGVYRAVALIPYVVPSVAAALIWRWLFDGSSGLFNAVLVRLGVLDRFVPWLGEAGTALPAVVLESVWKGTPFVMLVVLAGLQAIPRELYEAGALDGATAAARFRYITLPLLRPTLGVATILTAVYTVNNFNAIWLMTQGGPLHSTEILFTLAYKAAFQRFDFGMAATISVVLFGLLALATAAYLFLVERDEEVAL